MKRIVFSESAGKSLLKLDKTLAKRIIGKIEFLKNPTSNLQIKKLKGEESLFRIRVGDYRIIFVIDIDTILITKIGHRKDIYK